MAMPPRRRCRPRCRLAPDAAPDAADAGVVDTAAAREQWSRDGLAAIGRLTPALASIAFPHQIGCVALTFPPPSPSTSSVTWGDIVTLTKCNLPSGVPGRLRAKRSSSSSVLHESNRRQVCQFGARRT